MQRTWGQEFQAKSKCKGPVVAASWSVWWVGAARSCSWRRIVQTGQGGRQEPHHAHRRSKKTHFYFESNGKLLKLLGFYLTMMVWPPDWRVECICVCVCARAQYRKHKLCPLWGLFNLTFWPLQWSTLLLRQFSVHQAACDCKHKQGKMHQEQTLSWNPNNSLFRGTGRNCTNFQASTHPGQKRYFQSSITLIHDAGAKAVYKESAVSYDLQPDTCPALVICCILL